MPGIKSILLQSLGKTIVWPLMKLPFGQNPLSYVTTFAINHAKKAALVIRAVHCDY